MADLRPTEKPDVKMEGPFGGILDFDFPYSMMEKFLGYIDTQNIMFRESTATVRFGYSALAALPNGHVPVGIFDFFDSSGVRHNAVATRDAFYKWDTGTQAWIQVTGALGGTDLQYFTATTVGQKLCFDQGVDSLWTWDGIAAVLAQPAGAPTGKYLMELDNHLLVMNTSGHPQRVIWSGIGDPTDWTSFASGSTDLFNAFGPINGGIKLYQLGYIFQQWGIVQVTPTGIGTNPFAFQPIQASKGKGLYAPYSLGGHGTDVVPYLSKDNVYAFNGVDSEPIGDHPVEGNRRVGARSRILADVKQAVATSIFGYTSTAISGRDFNAYWLLLPTGVVWVYNFDERNWTRFVFNNTATILGDFLPGTVFSISQLVGTIAQQNWTMLNAPGTNPLDTVFIGFIGGGAGSIDFSNFSESSWYLNGPQWILGDGRHTKTLSGIRFILSDLGSVTMTVSVTNELGQNETHVVTYGTGSGQQITVVVPFNINGVLLTVNISGAANQPFSASEIAPIYDTGEEVPATTLVS